MALSGLFVVRDCRLASAECPRAFSSSSFRRWTPWIRLDSRYSTERIIWIGRSSFRCLCASLERYVKTKEILDVSDALETLCRTIDERLPEPARPTRICSASVATYAKSTWAESI